MLVTLHSRVVVYAIAAERKFHWDKEKLQAEYFGDAITEVALVFAGFDSHEEPFLPKAISANFPLLGAERCWILHSYPLEVLVGRVNQKMRSVRLQELGFQYKDR